jgi:hypothetical protein
MKQIFKKGDKVFCHYFGGWGVVENIYLKNIVFPIRCSFPLGNGSFTEDGRFYSEGPPMLSFTEYTLEGFSQERPEELPKRGDVVWVRDNDNEPWFISHFISKENEWHLTSFIMNDKKYLKWRQLTTKNPYENN